jgi:ABC-2 type transport system permease protein
MPDSIRLLSEFSPLYWGLSAFQTIFLSNGSLRSIFPYLLKLVLFFVSTVGVAYFYNKEKRH